MSAVIPRREWLLGLGASCATFCVGGPASAGAALPISLAELVQNSRFALVGTPKDTESAWESDGRGRRIVTYTRVEMVQSVDGRLPDDSEFYVRTLGGRVGDVGQIVHGEAELERGRASIFFLHEALAGAYGITAMAQGHYPLSKDDDGVHRLNISRTLSDFIRKDPYSAVARLRGKTVADAERLVLEALHDSPPDQDRSK